MSPSNNRLDTWEDLYSRYPYLSVLNAAAAKVPRGGVIVELGCHYGKATISMASACSAGQKIYAIDHFLGTETEKEDFERIETVIKDSTGLSTKELFYKNASCYSDVICLVESTFDEALKNFSDESIDMIFFDGDHMNTYDDLAKWWPKLKDGGIAYGHDINQKKFTVKEDVERFCSEHSLKYSVPQFELFSIRKGKERQPHAYIITMGYNTRVYAKACLLSVADCLKSYKHITHVVVDDRSTDGTWERLQQEDLKADHVILCQPPQHTGSPLASFMYGLSQVNPKDDDVIFWLDGDDWLTDPRAIQIMMQPYKRNPSVEMAYSQHIRWDGEGDRGIDGVSRPIFDPTNVRGNEVAFSHLRSFKFSLLRSVDEKFLKDPDTGEYWETCGDSALFLPMLEVARRIAFVNKPLYAYNCSTGENEWSSKSRKVVWNSMRLRNGYHNLNNRPEYYPESRFTPVRRFKVDFGRACDIKCRGCYYLHSSDKHNLTDEQIASVLLAGRDRGCRMCDFSGGEPTLYKEKLPEWITMARRAGLIPGIITHGQRLTPMLNELWERGLGDILFSIHGSQESHNWWTQTSDGYSKLWDAIAMCAREGFKFRTNTVLHSGYKELPKMALELSTASPYISNFINFNPYYEWEEKEHPFQARISDIAPYLKESIDILTAGGTMVNVRYFPFCALKGYEKHIVDMPQVMFDPYEWDYTVMPKTVKRYNQYGIELASKTRTLSDKCYKCSLAGSVCYGANTVYLNEHGDGELQPYDMEAVSDPFYFRKNADPGQLWTHIGHNFEWSFKRGYL